MFEPIPTGAPGTIGNLPKLSAEDCFQIKTQYGCDTMTLPCDTDGTSIDFSISQHKYVVRVG